MRSKPNAFSEFNIRRATEKDAAGILNCLRIAFEAYRTSYTAVAFRDTVLTPKTLRLRFSSMHIFVALHVENQIVGTISCALLGSGEGHLRGMAVLPEWQGRGLAEGLLRSAEADLTRNNCSRITLDTTEPLQRAVRFYEKQGYRRSGKVTEFFGMQLHEYVKDLTD